MQAEFFVICSHRRERGLAEVGEKGKSKGSKGRGGKNKSKRARAFVLRTYIFGRKGAGE